jgi:hypothetical protein
VHPLFFPHPLILFVYMHRFITMGHATTNQGAIAKVVILVELVDLHIEVIGDLQGKVVKTWLIDIDFMDVALFLKWKSTHT